MTSAWFLGSAMGVPQDDSVVRSTIEPVRTDGETAEQTAPPDWNQFDTDESGQLTGLSPRVAGSDTHDTEKYVPWWTRLASYAHNILVDEKIASSGTAARREETGQQGHGTMQYAVGIEPVIRDGAAYGNDYFVTAPKDIQEGMGAYMTPPNQDNWLQGLAQANATKDSRKAYQATLYQSLLTG